jgi:hypothetical protein
MIAAALLFATAAEMSRSLTSAAEELLKIEKKIVASNEGLGSVLYEDVLTLLDEAIANDSSNLHAHALAGEVLLLRSDQGDGTFDICALLDARDEAEYVLKHGGSAGDAATARGTLRAIQGIPPDAIPDPPSSCGESEEQRHGSRPRSS